MVDVDSAPTRSRNPYFPPADGRCPINDLPPELLSHIFLLGSAEYTQDEQDEDEEEAEADNADNDEEDDEEDEDEEEGEPEWEVLVSHVCHRWREVALNTPALWTTLDSDCELEKIRVYLERSQNAPLVLSFDLAEDDDDDEEDEGRDDDDDADTAKDVALTIRLGETLALIMPHVGHWRSFELMVSDYALMHLALLEFGRAPAAPILEELLLYVYDDTDEYDTFHPEPLKQQDFVLFGGSAPKLTHVALWGVHLDWARSHFLSGLQEFELAYHAKDVRPSFADVARILHGSPELHTLTFCLSGPAGGPVEWLTSMFEDVPEGVSVSTTLALPSVKKLVLAYLEPAYVMPLVERLALPHLAELALDLEQDDFSDFLVMLARPASATGKPLLAELESLKVSGLPCGDEAVAEALGALSNLTYINLNFGFIENSWARYLIDPPSKAAAVTSPSGARVFCPRLQTLTVTGLDGGEVMGIIAARKNAGVPIRQLQINEDDHVDEEQDEWLRQNVESFETFEASDDEIVFDGSDVDMDIEEVEEDGTDDFYAWEDVD
ncbi:hypothetical protein BKA93DRAFT_736093 [Sparassis latifolia]